jgi:prepilin-type N-terminal cleavage/methylation domain-containing protein
MGCQSEKARFAQHALWQCRALTLLEMVIALAIVGVVFAVLLPQLSAIRNSWDSRSAAAEILQNGRILIDHMNRNLSKAVRVTAVSGPAETIGYIEFEDNDGSNLRYDVAADYVEFGLIGNLADLAGPVSQLQFTCYDACDLDMPITDVNSIRSVKVQTTLLNSSSLGQLKMFTTQVYLRTNTTGPPELRKESPYEYDGRQGNTPALCGIDSRHYLCAYQGQGGDGYAVVLTVNPANWTITRETPFEFDTRDCVVPALCQIDATHYLCAYEGNGGEGQAVVLTVNTGNWTISKGSTLSSSQDFTHPAISRIDSRHYLCAFQGRDEDGYAVVVAVDTGDWSVSPAGTLFEYNTSEGREPALAKIDDEHYLCAHRGPGGDGWAVVLTVNTGSWTIGTETPFEYDNRDGREPALAQIDSRHYLCAYRGSGSDGWAVVLTVNPGSYAITKETAFEYDSSEGREPALAQIDTSHYLCAYRGPGGDGWATVLAVDGGDWTISKTSELEYDTSEGRVPALARIDGDHHLCAYRGPGTDGWSVVLSMDAQIRP